MKLYMITQDSLWLPFTFTIDTLGEPETAIKNVFTFIQTHTHTHTHTHPLLEFLLPQVLLVRISIAKIS